MSEDVKESFSSLLHSISLADIAVVGLSFRKTGNPTPGIEMKISWNQALSTDSPLKVADSVHFKLKYDLEIKQEDSSIYVHSSEFVVSFSVVNESDFDKYWSESETREVFLKNQITTTVWPIFRQNVLDGMSRLGLKPITMPWLFKEI